MFALDFVVVGAQKAGTSLLAEVLGRSPRLAIPEREVRHFRDPFFPHEERPEACFSPDDAGRLKGVKHPAYLSRPETPRRLFDHAPAMKIVAILRDPCERFVASYLHYVRHGQIPCIHPETGIPLALERPDRSPKYREMAASSEYAENIARYLEWFPREQIHVVEFESFVRDPSVVRDLFAFLGAPVPDGAWPLPRVNEGSYDWARCEEQHWAAKTSLIYDGDRNIVGRYGEPMLARAVQPAPAPLALSPSVRERLRDRYASQHDALVRLGVLDPRHW